MELIVSVNFTRFARLLLSRYSTDDGEASSDTTTISDISGSSPADRQYNVSEPLHEAPGGSVKLKEEREERRRRQREDVVVARGLRVDGGEED